MIHCVSPIPVIRYVSSKTSGLAVAVTTTSPYTADSYPVKNEESTMPNNIITDTHAKGESPNVIVKLTPGDIESKDWAFLHEWAYALGVSLEELLTRILIAAAIGQLYVEKIPGDLR